MTFQWGQLLIKEASAARIVNQASEALAVVGTRRTEAPRMFHQVFCRSDRVPTGQDVANWVMDGATFDENPAFNPPFESLTGTGWGAIDVIYDEGRRPLQIHRETGDECAPHVEAAVTVLRERGYYREKAELVAKLRETKQIFTIEFDEELCDDAVWELLDSFEMRLAREFDGITFADDEGFFDGRNQPFVKFS